MHACHGRRRLVGGGLEVPPPQPAPEYGPRAFAMPSPINTKAFARRCRRVRLMVGPRTVLAWLLFAFWALFALQKH